MNDRETVFFHSPVGWLELTADDEFLWSVRKVPHKGLANDVHNLILQEATRQLAEYFAGDRRKFDLPLRQNGTPFSRKVWDELMNIPYGEVISYQTLAERTGNPRACRAAGHANGRNDICIIVPCHRVIRADNSIGGYAYGKEMKRRLLELEQQHR